MENKNTGFQEKEFKELLRKGIGSRTQKEFAAQTGIAQETISRMLNDTGISCPRIKTLETIASKMSNVTLSELMVACGYQMPDIEDVIRKFESDIDDFFQFKAEGLDIYEDLKDLKNKILKFLIPGRGAVSINFTDYGKSDMEQGFIQVWPEGAEESKVMEITWEYDRSICCTTFNIYYICTAKGKMILVGSDILNKLHESGPYIQNTIVKEKKSYEQEARLLRAIFGSKTDRRFPYAHAGYGLYLDGLPEGFTDFLNKHADTFCCTKENMELYNRILEGESAEKVFSDFWDCNGCNCGFGAVISDIMSMESGREYLYYEPDEYVPEEDRNSCIMERAEHDMIDRMEKSQVKYLYQCARELKIQKFGVVYYHTTIQEETDQLYDLDNFYLC